MEEPKRSHTNSNFCQTGQIDEGQVDNCNERKRRNILQHKNMVIKSMLRKDKGFTIGRVDTEVNRNR